MQVRLIPMLRCVVCGSQLILQGGSGNQERVMEGTLLCTANNHAYPITGGIPRMLPSVVSKDKQDTAQGFGYEWKHFKELTDQYRQQFLDWVAPLHEEDFKGKTVLDAGCGKGRHTYVVSQFGAKEVIGMDLSESVEAAYENTKHLLNVHIVQADMFHPPFEKDFFDVIYSVGVVHHLPDPKEGFSVLTKYLRPGGKISVWVYGREHNGWIVYGVSPIRKLITSRLPLSVLHILSFFVTIPLYLIIELIYRPFNWAYPHMADKVLFYNKYLFYISKFSFREIYSIVFDHLLAPTAFYLREGEVRQWYTDNHLHDVTISPHNNNSWRATGVR